MRVGIDYLPAVTHEWGLGRYTREMVRAMLRLPEAPRLHLLELGAAPRRLAPSRLGLSAGRVRRIPLKLPRRLAVAGARWLGLPLERLGGAIDLFHHVRAPFLPVRGARQVLTLAELPQPGSRAEAELGHAARAMDAVLVLARAFGAEAARRLDLEAARVHAVPVGCDHWTRESARRTPWAEPDAQAPPQLLVLGAVTDDREPGRIVSAFEGLLAGGREARLLFVGRPASGSDELERALARSPARRSIDWERSPQDERMPDILARTSVLVHLASSATSAVTPLEACAAGAAVVATRLPVLEEVLGDLAHWAPARAPVEALSEILARALESAAQETGRAARLALAARHSWECNARATLELWRAVMLAEPEVPTPAAHGA